MHRPQRATLRRAVLHALASFGVLFLVLAAAVVVVAGGTMQPVAGHPERPAPSGSALWQTAYSQRYPGCVSMVLWPLDEVPVALVTRTPAGAVSRVPLEEVGRAPLSTTGRAIGACRG